MSLPLNSVTAPIGKANALLRATSRVHHVRDFPGPLSIKSVVQGEVTWRCGKRDLKVNDTSFLVLNDGEPYSMDIESRQPVSTFCLFFEPGLVESVYSSMAVHDPDAVEIKPLTFISRLHQGPPPIAAPSAPSDEFFLSAARSVLLLYRETRREIQRVPAMKASTRGEIDRRLCVAREYMHSNAGVPLTLSVIAREACLSQYHLHRAFKAVFGVTTGADLTRVRMERAHSLVVGSRQPIESICTAVGFESAPSFSALFRRTYGSSPTQIRKLR